MASSNYNEEIETFLHKVNNLTEEDLLGKKITNTKTNDGDEDDDDALSVDTATTTTTVNATTEKAADGTAVVGANRFRWKIQHVVGEYVDKEDKKKKYCNPFLSDNNMHDLIFYR
jgi:hypothetical protein